MSALVQTLRNTIEANSNCDLFLVSLALLWPQSVFIVQFSSGRLTTLQPNGDDDVYDDLNELQLATAVDAFRKRSFRLLSQV